MRQPKPYQKKSRPGYFVNIGGRTVTLGKDEKAAWEKYHKLMAGRLPVEADCLVTEILARFLAHHETNSCPGTLGFYKRSIESFQSYLVEKKLTRLRVSAIKAYHVTDWMDARHRMKRDAGHKVTAQATSDTYRHILMRGIKAAFNWAEAQELIDRAPLRNLRMPPQRSRDVYLMPEKWETLVAAIERGQDAEPMLDMVHILRSTGCRPQEARTVEARHFDRAGRCWIFPAEESKGKRESRIVLLNDRAFAICERMLLKNTDGPLFRNRDGQPWRKDALGLRCRRLAKRLGFHVCPYAIRHTFATDAIVAGVDLQTIASLMGHTDLKMLSRIYQHIRKRGDHLRAGLRKATGEDAA